MNSKTNLPLLAAVIAVFGLAMAGCVKEGPAERAGKSVDKAVEKVGNKIENAGDKVQDAVKGK